jgi:carbon storage regulator
MQHGAIFAPSSKTSLKDGAASRTARRWSDRGKKDSQHHGGADMLVLSRKIGERIVINHNTTVEVLQIIGNRVRLGVTAPSGVPILREELINGRSQQGAPREDTMLDAAATH